MTDRTLTSNPNNENLVAELEAAAAKWVLEKSKYTLECLRDARRAVLKQMQPTGNETFDDAAELAFYRASIPESLRWDRVDPNVKDAWRKHTQKAEVCGSHGERSVIGCELPKGHPGLCDYEDPRADWEKESPSEGKEELR